MQVVLEAKSSKPLAGEYEQTTSLKPMLKPFFVVNPVGGFGKAAKQWPLCYKLLRQAGISLEYAFTQAPMHAAELAEEAVRAGFRQIIAVGGDGTLHEVINGMVRQPYCPLSELTVSLCPLGTGNDWVRTYQIPTRLNKWVAMLSQARTKEQDLGVISYSNARGQKQERYFVNIAGMAYDAFVVHELQTTGQRSSNTLMYMLGILKFLWKYEPYRYRILFAERQITKKLYTLNVGICRFSGGGMQLVPHAIPDDGLLALTIVEAIPKWEVLLQIPRIFNGKIGQHPKVEQYQVPSLQVESTGKGPLLLEADGEFICSCDRVSLGVYPEKVHVIC